VAHDDVDDISDDDANDSDDNDDDDIMMSDVTEICFDNEVSDLTSCGVGAVNVQEATSIDSYCLSSSEVTKPSAGPPGTVAMNYWLMI